MLAVAKDLIADRIRGLFNDRTLGEAPIRPQTDGLFGPKSVAWRVHSDVTTMMVGGTAALLLQMLHPAVLAGVWDHSNFRNDTLGRLRRTARFIAVTTYGGRADALMAIDRVRAVHEGVQGKLPDGTDYCAEDPELLAWVHVTETMSFLDAWIRFRELSMSLIDRDRYFAEMAEIALQLGAGEVPRSRAEALSHIACKKPVLCAGMRTQEVVHVLRGVKADNPVAMAIQRLTFQAAIDLLPDWARRMHRLSGSTITRPVVQGSTLTLAKLAQWALRRT